MVRCGYSIVRGLNNIGDIMKYYGLKTIVPTFHSTLVPGLIFGIMRLNHMVTITRDTFSNCLVLTELFSPSINVSNIQCDVLLEVLRIP